MKTGSREAMIRGNNADVVRNTIYFTRKKNKNQVFLLVEGEGDVGFYKNVVDKTNVQIIPMGGNPDISAKEEVIRTIEMFNKLKMQGVVAIVDTDYDEIIGNKQFIDNLIYTDDHDMETMILKTDAYEKFENEFGDEERIRAYKIECGSLLDNILKCGSIIGKCRLLSIREDLNLCFKDVHLEEYIDESLQFDWKKYFKQVLYVSKKILQKEELSKKVQNDSEKYNIWQLCRGHDITELMVIFYSQNSKYKLGNGKARNLKPERVEQFLRAAYYIPANFVRTYMFERLLEWQTNNKEWSLLKKDFVQLAA